MELDGRRLAIGQDEPFDAAVVEIDVGDHRPHPIQRARVHREPVILTGDFDPFRRFVQDRHIAPVVAELKLVGVRTGGQSHHLVSQANPQQGHGSDQLAKGFDGLRDRLGIPRPVAHQHAVRTQRANVFRFRSGGHHGHAITPPGQVA
jgi:hypothetical protein